MQGLGLDPQKLAAQRLPAAPTDDQACRATAPVMAVWPEHWEVLQLFLRCTDQFEVQIGPMGGLLYSAARAVNVAHEMTWLSVRGASRRAELRTQYLVMERQALHVLNERAAHKR